MATSFRMSRRSCRSCSTGCSAFIRWCRSIFSCRAARRRRRASRRCCKHCWTEGRRCWRGMRFASGRPSPQVSTRTCAVIPQVRVITSGLGAGGGSMTKRLIIDPVARIEGHAKITIYLDDRGQVTDARFHVTEFRGFERFCQGRPFYEMAGLSARICGICPVSHLLASAKAGDRILAVAIPPGAQKLRRLMNLAQFIQSHALSFFHLSGPDLLLGWNSDPAQRNVFGLMASHPDMARAGIRLRQLGQEIIESLGGRKIHPAWSVPGGVRENLPIEARDRFRARLPEALAVARRALDFFKGFLDTHAEETQVFGNFSSLFMGLVTPDG